MTAQGGHSKNIVAQKDNVRNPYIIFYAQTVATTRFYLRYPNGQRTIHKVSTMPTSYAATVARIEETQNS